MQVIILTQSQVAYVDDEDFPWLNQYNWYAQDGRYAVRYINNSKEMIFMHIAITEYHKLVFLPELDHIDRNGFNNQKHNFRAATRQEQNWNRNKQIGNYTSKYIGIFWHTPRQRWTAVIRNSSGKKEQIGRFKNEIDAAIAYDRMCILYRGVRAVTNFPHSNYPDLAIYVK